RIGSSCASRRPTRSLIASPRTTFFAAFSPRRCRKLRTDRFATALLAVLVLVAAGCRQDMAFNQPRYKALQPSSLFEDRRSARPLVPGTVPRQRDAPRLRDNPHLYASKTEKAAPDIAAIVAALSGVPATALAAMSLEDPYVDTFPFPVTAAVLQRGQ